MELYNKNLKKEQKLVKPVSKNHPRWKIGRWIMLVLVLLFIGGMTCFLIGADIEAEGLTDTIMFSSGIALLPFCFILCAYCRVICGGRDILLARYDEKIYLEDSQLRNVFVPRFRQNICADMVQIIVPYSWVRDMVWNERYYRLEIVADYRYLLHNFNNIREEVVTGKNVIIYDYYDGMEQMIYSLEQRTGKAVRREYYNKSTKRH